MRKLLVIIAAASVVLALAGVPAVSAATSSARLTFTRIVIFNGLSNKPVGPKGPLTPSWTVYPKPADITTTNFGRLVEDTSLSYVGVTHGGTWWYGTSGVILHAFYWEHGGKKVKATSLAVPPMTTPSGPAWGTASSPPTAWNGWRVTPCISSRWTRPPGSG